MLGQSNARMTQLEAENRRLRSRPVSEYVVPVPSARPALIDSTAGDEDEDEDDDEYQDSEIGF